ncbi:hypothetical protein VB713_16945 [Anabaena cylindrica UHCC 0172]|uniref:hypothetical protein n=1 Tax=Anabaena cylindrica TaxID=1165 RepID=UPI002B21D506|nr:hypothetical protein [Anabaena cylindrica]MEA5552632.1 hypothetical protein [Anabaena cylindrica UHCC 0172]
MGNKSEKICKDACGKRSHHPSLYTNTVRAMPAASEAIAFPILERLWCDSEADRRYRFLGMLE